MKTMNEVMEMENRDRERFFNGIIFPDHPKPVVNEPPTFPRDDRRPNMPDDPPRRMRCG